MQETRLTGFQRFDHGLDNRVLHTAAADRAADPSVAGDTLLRANTPWGRAPGLHHGGKRHGLPIPLPAFQVRQYIAHGSVILFDPLAHFLVEYPRQFL